MRLRWATVGLSAVLALSACSPAPESVAYGVEECGFCRMVIADPPFAAQAVSRTGRTFKFDSVECMAAFVLRGDLAAEETHSLWVQDLDSPGPWLRAEKAAFLHGGVLRSPMGLSLAAVDASRIDSAASRRHQGERLSWDEVLDLVERAWSIEVNGR